MPAYSREQPSLAAAMLKSKIAYFLIRFAPYWLQKRNPEAAKRLADIEGKIFLIEFSDINSKYFLSVKDAKFKNISPQEKYDVAIKGKTFIFIGLLTKHYDADELFFRRLLKMEGDIETTTYLKNILAHF